MKMAFVLLALGAAATVVGCSRRDDGPPGAIKVTAGEKGFEPSSVKLKKGGPGTVVFTRTTDDTCATEVVFPQLDLKKELPKGKAVAVDLPTDKEQTLTFQCGMGMYKSAVVVSAN